MRKSVASPSVADPCLSWQLQSTRNRFLGTVPYDVAKVAVNRLSFEMAKDLEEKE